MFTYPEVQPDGSTENVRSRWVAVTIEIRKNIEIPIDSTFKISKSITNVVQMNIDFGMSKDLARETSDRLVGKRLANVDELVYSYQELGGIAKKAADNLNGLIVDAREKVRQIDLEGMQKEAREMLVALREPATDLRGLVQDNRERIDRLVSNVEQLTTALKDDWPKMSAKAQGVLDEAREAAAKTRIPISQLYGVATFYSQFHLTRRGRHLIPICDGTACHVSGAGKNIQAIENAFSILAGGTSSDYKYTLEIVYCVGSCGLAPVAVVNDKVYGQTKPEPLVRILKKLE